MTSNSNAAFWLHAMRYLGIILIVMGIPIFIYGDSAGAEMPLLVGLFTLMISIEKKEDERSVQIRTTSLYIAFVIAYTLKLVTTTLHDHMLISFELVQINHFLILTLALANAIYYSRLYIFSGSRR